MVGLLQERERENRRSRCVIIVSIIIIIVIIVIVIIAAAAQPKPACLFGGGRGPGVWVLLPDIFVWAFAEGTLCAGSVGTDQGKIGGPVGSTLRTAWIASLDVKF